MKSVLKALCIALLTVTTLPVAFAAETPTPAKAQNPLAPKAFASAQKEGSKATCPVMGEAFVIDKATRHSVYKGKHVYFCCPGCKAKFDKDPEKYLK